MMVADKTLGRRRRREEDGGPGLLALNGNIADLENEEEDRDYDETGDHEDDDDDVKDEEG